jgi:hypothetical protein
MVASTGSLAPGLTVAVDILPAPRDFRPNGHVFCHAVPTTHAPPTLSENSFMVMIVETLLHFHGTTKVVQPNALLGFHVPFVGSDALLEGFLAHCSLPAALVRLGSR